MAYHHRPSTSSKNSGSGSSQRHYRVEPHPEVAHARSTVDQNRSTFNHLSHDDEHDDHHISESSSYVHHGAVGVHHHHQATLGWQPPQQKMDTWTSNGQQATIGTPHDQPAGRPTRDYHMDNCRTSYGEDLYTREKVRSWTSNGQQATVYNTEAFKAAALVAASRPTAYGTGYVNNLRK